MDEYVSWFFLLVVLGGLFYWWRKNQQAPQAQAQQAQQNEFTADFQRFQRLFLGVYLIMNGADWLQGPYVYALYRHYNFDIGAIGRLFIFGFGASMLFGTIVGSTADKYGRKTLCLFFGLIYSLSCITKHFGSYDILLVGRLLGGVATSILFSAFESWMVSEHNKNGYRAEWLSSTFSYMSSGNSLVAIAAGVIASFARDTWGPVAPFDVSLVFLLVGSLIIAFNWAENTGDAQMAVSGTLAAGWARVVSDRKVVLLGLIQSFFEGAMYIFVFMWTPALESTLAPGEQVRHGWVFACFMICVFIGSNAFTMVIESTPVEQSSIYLFFAAAVSLTLPAFVKVHSLRLVAFFVFEACVGMFWPSLGTMRSRYVPEEVRATVMNFFRVPLNFIVIVVLYNIDGMSEFAVFMMCVCCLGVALLCQMQLWALVQHRRSAPGTETIAEQEPMNA